MSSTALISIEAVGREIKARVEAGDKAMDKASQHYIAAGIQLLDAHKRLKETREMRWSAFLFSHARLNEEVAHRYMALASGKVTIDEVREAARKRQQKSRDNKKAQKALGGPVCDVTNEISQQNQCAATMDERIDRIVEALPAASLDIITQIERLLNIEEKLNV